MKITVSVFSVLLASVTMAADEVPVAGWVSHPVRPGEHVLVSGIGVCVRK